jgi:hypothetical protein
MARRQTPQQIVEKMDREMKEKGISVTMSTPDGKSAHLGAPQAEAEAAEAAARRGRPT